MITFLWILLLIASLILQTTILIPLRRGGVRIDLVILLTIFAGLYGGEIKGGATGFFGGILEDSLSGSLMGMGALSKTVVGSFCGFLGTKLCQKNVLAQLIVSFLSILIHELIYLCLIFFFRTPFPSLSAAVKMAALAVVINTLLAPPFFWVVSRIFKFKPKVYKPRRTQRKTYRAQI